MKTDFTDQVLKCAECETEFIFGVEQQRALAARGEVGEPSLCPPRKRPGNASEEQPTTTTGQVKRFSVPRGYGFITRDDGRGDVFVHHSGIQGEHPKALVEGQRIILDVMEEPKGPTAVNVVPKEEP